MRYIGIILMGLMGFLYASEPIGAACDHTEHTQAGLKGNFLKKDTFEGASCNHTEHAPKDSIKGDKTLKDMKAFLHSPYPKDNLSQK
ncbi:hypothetical protein BKH46_02955 [Helicobacter sp. 12S02634-8]|uniref:hypothetical protein n=1 Tax=Helicobacter sp. 12S02634-8 TaxID=1476199 RepID=UPI000BA5CC18|nr:hypothetical protein [Helicobacter sp. 12S02634-8]PAF47806.1 hypothetical protein BKH46_02955 [Helicobacter sp. 12S02634-8]